MGWKHFSGSLFKGLAVCHRDALACVFLQIIVPGIPEQRISDRILEHGLPDGATMSNDRPLGGFQDFNRGFVLWN